MVFCTKSFQANGTIIQRPHASSSTKGASRSRKLKRITDCNNNLKRNKSSTKLPVEKEMCCPFCIVIFLSIDNMWYLDGCGTENLQHLGHLYIPSRHKIIPKSLISTDVIAAVSNLQKNDVNTSSIRGVLLDQHHVQLSEEQIRTIRQENLDKQVEHALDIHNLTGAERFIELLSSIEDMNYIYVTHDITSGYVTMKRTPKRALSNTITSADDVAVSQEAMESWRSDLRVGSGRILVSIAWALDTEVAEHARFPEFMACDVTFGVNKNQRNMSLMTIVDGNMKV